MRATPKTKREGEARALQVLRELGEATSRRWAPAKCGKVFDRAMREALGWPADARRGFARVCGDWLATEVTGLGYDVDQYETALKRGKPAGR